MDEEFRSVMMNPNDPGAFEPDARVSDPLYVAIDSAITTALIDVWPACEQAWVDALATSIMEEVIASGKRNGDTIKVKVGEGW